MSLFSIFSVLLILAYGKVKSHNGGYEEELYPIQVQLKSLDDDWVLKKWIVLAPKHRIRSATNIFFEHPSERNPIYSNEMDIAEPSLWWVLRRAWNLRPLTEMGPGSFKSDIYNFPPQTLGNRIKKLLEMQTKQAEEEKDINVLGDDTRLNRK